MSNIVDKAYLKLKKDEAYKAKYKLKRINIDMITENITKNCWNYNIHYNIILKNSDFVIIKLTGAERTILFKYHKKEKVLLQEYETFLECLNQHDIERGIYITTGVFDEKINKYIDTSFYKKVQKIDGIKFMKKQFSIEQLSFLEYLPQ